MRNTDPASHNQHDTTTSNDANEAHTRQTDERATDGHPVDGHPMDGHVEDAAASLRTGLARLIMRMVKIGGIGILAAFVVIVIVETADVVALADRIHPMFGTAVLSVLLVLYAVAIIAPIVLYRRYPRALPPPDPDDAAAVAVFRANLASRLGDNARVRAAEIDVHEADGVERALELLDTEANALIVSTAKAVFASTAISQSGRLDGLVVLFAQTRMVWEIARIYHQRPHPGEVLRLYKNVAFTSLLAMQIEDLAVEEQLEPLTAPILSMVAADRVPIAGSVLNIMVKSIIDGGLNAFLTLRVGVICRSYCRATTTLNSTEVRRSAAREAAAMLNFIPQDIGNVASSVGRAVKQRSYTYLRNTGNRIWRGLGFGRSSRRDDEKKDG